MPNIPGFDPPPKGRQSAICLRRSMSLLDRESPQLLGQFVADLWVLTAACLLVGCGPNPTKATHPSGELPMAKVSMRKVEQVRQPLIEEVLGSVRAKLQATLEAKISGRVLQIPVVLGQKLQAGELVARLDSNEFIARFEQAEAAWQQAERDWKRSAALLQEHAVTRAENETVEARYRVAKAAVAEAKVMLGYAEIAAPFAGVVTKKWSDIGDFAAPGKPLVTLEDPSALQLEADVPQAIAGYVIPGATLLIRVDGIAQSVSAIVSEIAPGGDAVSRTLRIKLNLPPVPGLKSGQFARLQIPVGESQSLRIPTAAVVDRGQLELVFVALNQRAQLRLVKTGQRTGEAVEILAGLSEGETVIVTDVDRLIEGQSVEAK